MKNNTIVMASDQRYFWGVTLLLASLRKNGMDEPVLVFQTGFTPELKQALHRFGGVEFVDAPPSPRSMTCRKPEALLLPGTEYVTWADCDGFFRGNCSELLTGGPGMLHIRVRTPEESDAAFRKGKLYQPGDAFGAIPRQVLDLWRRDVPGARAEPALGTCPSCCCFSLHHSLRPFLELWKAQIEKVLPNSNVGVTDHRLIGYYQLEESVLASLLCFSPAAPPLRAYRLDQEQARRFRHIIDQPKPWMAWSRASLRFHTDLMDIMDWLVENDLLPRTPPFPLNPKYRALHALATPLAYGYRLRNRLRRMLRR